MTESPESTVAHFLAVLPDVGDLAPLHSNPGSSLTFVTEDGKFSGFIDFGDACISHRALDFRPWRDAVDMEARLAGYSEERPLSPGFMACYSVAAILGEMTDLVRGRVSPRQARRRIERLRASFS